MKYLRLTWDDIEEQCKILGERIIERGMDFDTIIGIARGGWIPARLLSDMLDNDEVYTVRVKFYKSVGKTREKPMILHPTQFNITDKKVLLVDDIADTGESLLATLEHLKERGTKEIFVVTLIKKPHSKIIPDFFVKETDSWVIFPWEVHETIRDIVERYGKGERAMKEFIKTGIEEKTYVKFISNV